MTMENFGTIDSSENNIAILGIRCRPHTAKREGDKMSKKCQCGVWKKRNDVGGGLY